MEYFTDLNITQSIPSVITIGNFDGLHLGHRKLITTAKQYGCRNHYKSIAFSFYPHPSIVLNKNEFAGMIFSRNEKKKRLEQLGIDIYIECPFTKEFSNISAKDFVEKILLSQLNAKIIVIGSNNKFGKNQEGNVHFLKEGAEEWGLSIIEITPVLHDNLIVSSTRVREVLANGNIEKVNELLVVPYGITGTIVEGKKLGRQLGYPTANILAQNNRLYPPNGVYFTKTKYKNRIYNSVTNIGCNPTVNNDKIKVIETYINDFCHMAYGKKIDVEFYKWIRKEHKFESLEDLINQLNIDVDLSRKYFK